MHCRRLLDNATSLCRHRHFKQATKVAAAKKQKLAAGAKAKSIASVASKKSAKPATSKTVKAPASTNGTPKKRKKDNEEETEVFRWWEQDLDGSVKWSTLEHNGVLFPPDYKPHGVRMKYDGKNVSRVNVLLVAIVIEFFITIRQRGETISSLGRGGRLLCSIGRHAVCGKCHILHQLFRRLSFHAEAT